MKRNGHFIIKAFNGGQFHWILVDRDSEPVATSKTGYSRRSGAVRAINLFKKLAYTAEIQDAQPSPQKTLAKIAAMPRKERKAFVKVFNEYRPAKPKGKK